MRLLMPDSTHTDPRVARESSRREFASAMQAAQTKLASDERFLDNRGNPFTVGASVLATTTIAYTANDGTGLKWTACGTRGEIIAFSGTREFPRAAVQFDGRASLHLFNARELRGVLRVIINEEQR